MNINERVAALEVLVTEQGKDAAERGGKQDTMLELLNELKQDMSSAKSFMGGAMWIGAGMLAFLWKVGPWLVDFFRAKTGSG